MSDSETKRGQKAKHLFPLSFITFREGITSAFLACTLTSIPLLAGVSLTLQCLGGGWPQQWHRGSTCEPATQAASRCVAHSRVHPCAPGAGRGTVLFHGISPSARVGLVGTCAGHSGEGQLPLENLLVQLGQPTAEISFILENQSERVGVKTGERECGAFLREGRI